MLCCALFFGASAYASELSPWATSEYEAANSAGLVPYSMVSKKLTDKVTRVEFCEAVMNFYVIMEGEIPEFLENPFTDTNNKAVIMAYSLGVINGKTPTKFFPNDSITRQEMAKIIMRTINAADKDAHITLEEIERLCNFEDFKQTDDWAVEDIAKSIKYEVINGVSATHLLPRGYATREQAIAILNRAHNTFSHNKTLYEKAELKNLSDGDKLELLSFSWTQVADARGYILIIKDAYGNMVYSENTNNTKISLYGKGIGFNEHYSVTIGTKFSENITVFSNPVDIFYGNDRDAINVIPTIEGRMNRVFPGGVAFTTKADADANMTTLNVPVWKMGNDGAKYSSTLPLMVNINLADEVMNIFRTIYNSPEKFPIKNVGGYSWRTTAFGSVSHHSYGTCIDINYDENYYCYPSGEAITGSFWKPYQNPFSITPDGSVVKAFSKYGWTWGGTWTSLKDYMHFSYLGK